jgi:single-strand DNA-binding protein
MFAKVTILGNVGRDPETRYTKSGTMNVSFSVATNRRFTDQSGQQQERTTWFRVTAWGKLAETVDKLVQQGFLTKGRQVLVSGRLETSEYTGQDGKDRTTLEVTADDVVLAGGRADGGQSAPSGSYRNENEQAAPAEDIDELPF